MRDNNSGLNESFGNLIHWSICNLSLDATGSPAMNYLASISKSVLELLESAGTFPTVATGCLKSLIKHQAVIDEQLIPKLLNS